MSDELRQAAERLLAELDHIARDYDHYEYGLPLHETDNDHHGRMVAAVTAALNPAAGWRPIDTLPADLQSGEIWVYTAKGHVGDWPVAAVRAWLADPEGTKVVGGPVPTHWMPYRKPAPPP